MEVRIVISATEESETYNLPDDLNDMVQFIWEAGAAGADVYAESGDEDTDIE